MPTISPVATPRKPPPVLLFALPAIVIFLGLHALAVIPACATAKADAIAAGKDCAAEVGPQVLKVVRDASYAAAEADLPAILAGLKDCVARAAAQAVADELGKLAASQALAAQAATPTAVPAATARERLTIWLASHPANAMLRREADHRLASIPSRIWRLLNAVPSPFVPARANC